MTILLLFGIYCAVVVFYWFYSSPRKKQAGEFMKSSFKNGHFVELSAIDVSFLSVQGVHFMTFFETKTDTTVRPTEWVRERVRAVLKANSWLAGRLTDTYYDKKAHKSLFVPEMGDSDYHLERCFNDLEVDDFAHTLIHPPRSAFADLGQSCINKDEPLWKVTFITHKTSSRCALFVSMSHIMGDGNTFFRIMNMLSETGPGPQSLDPNRVHLDKNIQNFHFFSRPIPLNSPTKIMQSIIKIITKLPAILFRKAPPGSLKILDTCWIDEEKVRSARSGTVVTSNDVITSHILREHSPCLGLMAMDLRKRMPQLKANLAGNYISMICLQPTDYATPEGIRKVLEKELVSLQIQGLLTQADETIDTVLVTNWAAFSRDMLLPGLNFMHQFGLVPSTTVKEDMLNKFWSIFRHAVVLIRSRRDDSIAVAQFGRIN